jgi:hypothetical protein
VKLAEKEKQIIRRLQSEINQEISLLDKLCEELDTLKQRLSKSQVSRLDLRAAGSIIHDFYNGVENIFRRIAQELNGGLPAGEDWHKQLLTDMALSIRDVRPSVISNTLKQELYKYLGFRHVFRNIYGFSLEEERIKILVGQLPSILLKLKQEIATFQGYLDKLAQ